MNARDSIRWHASNAGYELTEAEVEAVIAKSLDTIEAKRLAIQEASKAYEDYVIACAAEVANRPPLYHPLTKYLRQTSPNGGADGGR